MWVQNSVILTKYDIVHKKFGLRNEKNILY